MHDESQLKNRWLGTLLLAVLLVYSSHALPAWLMAVMLNLRGGVQPAVGYANAEALWSLLFSVLLVAHDPRGFGIRAGTLRQRWPGILAICLLPIVATALVYPRLANKPFSGGPICIWLISPLAQDLLFAGYFYRTFMDAFPGKLHRRIPFERSIVVTAAFFALWHTPGFLAGIGWYLGFQLVYTFAGACLMGVLREWTQSLVYITLVHMAVNYIAVYY